MRIWAVVNPAAGSGKGRKKSRSYIRYLRQAGIEVEVAYSQHPGHVYQLVANWHGPSSWDGLVAIGGDGTLFEVINALVRRFGEIPLPIGQVPVGTGNSLSRDLYPKGAASALKAIEKARVKAIDLIRYQSGSEVLYFANMMGIGFVSDINARSFRYKAMGKLAYAVSVVLETARLCTSRTTVSLDGRQVHTESLFVELCNSRYTAGNMLLAPMAILDDGQVDLLICRPMAALRLLRVFPKVFRGTHLSLPEVETLRGCEGEIAMDPPRRLSPDGEVMGTTPIHFRCLPGALPVFA
ncbi:MAG: diacylglycerol kinase family lipid kinase [candidate division KSB1 bacterium]|nr:diacylglycerol kinase family lipid kinase [candidate division KSB1 bacterium]